jgi:hypothetical protein
MMNKENQISYYVLEQLALQGSGQESGKVDQRRKSPGARMILEF